MIEGLEMRRFRTLTDTADNRSLECSTCGAVWIQASPVTSANGSDESDSCLRCGGTLLPVAETRADPQQLGH
jgi:hypothetical protein